jgi:hypothetical protein
METKIIAVIAGNQIASQLECRCPWRHENKESKKDFVLRCCLYSISYRAHKCHCDICEQNAVSTCYSGRGMRAAVRTCNVSQARSSLAVPESMCQAHKLSGLCVWHMLSPLTSASASILTYHEQWKLISSNHGRNDDMHAGFGTKERSLTRATSLSFQLPSALHYLSVQVETHVTTI